MKPSPAQKSKNVHSWTDRNLAVNWHPYTQMKIYEDYPPVKIEKAEGPYLYDEDGKHYYDTISSWWACVHGHAHPQIVSAITKQASSIDHVIFGGFTHEPAVLLSEKLVEITPDGLSRVFYADNGSCAVEVALKMSVQYWRNTGKSQKTGFICLEDSYHGDTIGTMGVGGVGLFKDVFDPLLVNAQQVRVPEDTSEAIELALSELKSVLEASSEVTAAMIVEPLMQGACGIRFYPAAYLSRARALCEAYDVLFIVDEIATGFGKLGALFACDIAKISPDFMCLSKAINNGVMPFAATLTTDAIYQAFYGDRDKTFYHGHTYTANPIGCATALASLSIFESENVMSELQSSKVPYFQAQWARLTDCPYVSDLRSWGMVGAFTLVSDSSASDDALLTAPYRMYLEGLKHHLVLRPLGNTVYVVLPFCLSLSQIDEILQSLKTVIGQVRL